MREYLVGSEPDPCRIGTSAPVSSRQAKDHSNDGVGDRKVLNMEERQPLTERLRFMVLLYAQPLAGMDPPQTALQRVIDLVGAKKICRARTQASYDRVPYLR